MTRPFVIGKVVGNLNAMKTLIEMDKKFFDNNFPLSGKLLEIIKASINDIENAEADPMENFLRMQQGFFPGIGGMGMPSMMNPMAGGPTDPKQEKVAKSKDTKTPFREGRTKSEIKFYKNGEDIDPEEIVTLILRFQEEGSAKFRQFIVDNKVHGIDYARKASEEQIRNAVTRTDTMFYHLTIDEILDWFAEQVKVIIKSRSAKG